MRLNRIGVAIRDAGDHLMAEALLRDAMEFNSENLREGHPNMAQTLDSLASVYRLQGRYDEAERTLREALTMNRDLLGDDNLTVAENLHTLGLILRARGDASAAAEMLRDSLDTYMRLGAENVPAALTVQSDLLDAQAAAAAP